MPDTPACASVRIRPKQRTKVSTAASGKTLSRIHGGQSYAMTLSYNPMLKTEAAPLIAFLQAQNGRHGIFRVRVPQVNGGGDLGKFVNFVGDTKLHMITSDSPRAYSPEPRGTGAVDAQPSYMRCSLARDAQEISLDKRGLIQLTIELIERV
ncbi:MAG: hypothetical protein AB3N28_14545, partial [Kordiimonas sp.]